MLGVTALACALGLASFWPSGARAVDAVVQDWVVDYRAEGSGQYSSDERGHALVVDGAGNVYVAGTSLGATTLNDFVTIKYDPNGTALWVARYAGPGGNDDFVRGIALDGQGNVYVTGSSVGLTTAFDYATVKYSPDGLEQWVARYNGPGSYNDEPSGLAVDAQGNVYVTGTEAIDGSRSQYATVKYDTNGQELWVANYGPGLGQDGAYAIDLDAGGNVLVTGHSRGETSDEDYATLKYDPDGRLLWSVRYTYPGVFSSDSARFLQVDQAGNVYVTGYSAGPTFWPDYLTIKYDANGNELWTARYDGAAHESDYVSGLGLDAQGNVYVTGNSEGYPVTLKYSPDGALVWKQVFMEGGPAASWVYTLAVDSDGGVVVGGCSSLGTGVQQAVAVKYEASGTRLWQGYYGTPGAQLTCAHVVAADAVGGVYWTGLSQFDLGFGNYRHDLTTLRYDAAAEAPPMVDLRVNGLDGPVTIQRGARVHLGMAVSPNGYAGPMADMALCRLTAGKRFCWVAGPLAGGGLAYVSVSAARGPVHALPAEAAQGRASADVRGGRQRGWLPGLDLERFCLGDGQVSQNPASPLPAKGCVTAWPMKDAVLRDGDRDARDG